MNFSFAPGIRHPENAPVIVQMSIREAVELQEFLNDRTVKDTIHRRSTSKSVARVFMRGLGHVSRHLRDSVQPGPLSFDPERPERQRGPSPSVLILDEAVLSADSVKKLLEKVATEAVEEYKELIESEWERIEADEGARDEISLGCPDKQAGKLHGSHLFDHSLYCDGKPPPEKEATETVTSFIGRAKSDKNFVAMKAAVEGWEDAEVEISSEVRGHTAEACPERFTLYQHDKTTGAITDMKFSHGVTCPGKLRLEHHLGFWPPHDSEQGQ